MCVLQGIFSLSGYNCHVILHGAIVEKAERIIVELEVLFTRFTKYDPSMMYGGNILLFYSKLSSSRNR